MNPDLGSLRIPSFFFLTITALLLSGCRWGSKLASELDPNSDLKEYRTYAVMPLPATIPGALPGTVPRYGGMVKETVEGVLNSKGYDRAKVETADFAVRIGGYVIPEIDVKEWGYFDYDGPDGYRWWETYPYSEIEYGSHAHGTLIIEVFDRGSKQMVWVAWASGKRKFKPPDPAKIKMAIRKMLSDFPDGESVPIPPKKIRGDRRFWSLIRRTEEY